LVNRPQWLRRNRRIADVLPYLQRFYHSVAQVLYTEGQSNPQANRLLASVLFESHGGRGTRPSEPAVAFHVQDDRSAAFYVDGDRVERIDLDLSRRELRKADRQLPKRLEEILQQKKPLLAVDEKEAPYSALKKRQPRLWRPRKD
jgi:hypothetical protein